MARKRQALRCKAANRRGKHCGNYAVLGALVCRMHGGCAPQVRQAARLRLDREAAARMVRSLRIDDALYVFPVPDGRLGSHKLPSCRRERYRTEVFRVRVANDPLLQAMADMLQATRYA